MEHIYTFDWPGQDSQHCLPSVISIEQSLAHWCHIFVSWPEVTEPRVTRFWGAVHAILPPHGDQCCCHGAVGPDSVLMYRLFLAFKAFVLGIWPVPLRSLLIFSFHSQNCQPFPFFQFSPCCIISPILLWGEQYFTESCWDIHFIPQNGAVYMPRMILRTV